MLVPISETPPPPLFRSLNFGYKLEHKDMLKQLEKEAEEDEEIYDKMACWCETNDKET